MATTFDAVSVLPGAAAKKLRHLREIAEDRRGASNAAREALERAREDRNRAQAAISQYESQSNLRLDPEVAQRLRKELEPLQAEFGRRNEAYQARNARWSTIKRLVTRIENYVGGLPSSTRIEIYSQPLAIRLGIGGKRASSSSPREAIDAARREIEALTNRIAEIESAPFPMSEGIAKIEAAVDALAVNGAPELDGILAGGREIIWPTDIRLMGEGAMSIPDVPALIAWLDPLALKRRLVGELEEAVGDDKNAIPRSDRPKMVADVRERLLAVERIEEAAISELEETGVEFERREGADPRAVLSVLGPTPRD
jgi:hypothetical protein